MARLILDTGVLIASVRGRIDLGSLGEDDDLAVPAIAVAEYVAGTLLDGDLACGEAQRGFLDDVLRVLPVCDYDREVAEHHAFLLAHIRSAGAVRGGYDLVVAATARATSRVLVTTDERARFGELPGVDVRLVAAGPRPQS